MSDSRPSSLSALFLETLKSSASVELALQAVRVRAQLTEATYSPRRLAAAVGVRAIEFSSIGGADAFVEPLGNGFKVVINRERPWRRQTFSLCHEVAHVLLGHAGGHRTFGEFGAQTTAERERLCDQIAGMILMPQQNVANLLKERGVTVSALQTLAFRTGASYKAAALRMMEVAETPALAIFWSFQDDRLVSASFHRSKTGRGCFLLSGAIAPEESSPMSSLKSGKPSSGIENLGWSSVATYQVESCLLGRSAASGIVSLVDMSKS